MTYFAVPYVAHIQAGQGAEAAAKHLSDLINHYGAQGWEYIRLEDVTTIVTTPATPGTPGNPGFLGCFATPSIPGTPTIHEETHYYMAVFKKA